MLIFLWEFYDFPEALRSRNRKGRQSAYMYAKNNLNALSIFGHLDLENVEMLKCVCIFIAIS